MRYQHVLGASNLDRPSPVRLLLKSPPAFSSISFFVVYLLTFQYLRYSNYRDPTSYFFDPSRAYDRIYSSKRIAEATAFIKSAGDVSPPPRDSVSPVMCVGVATVARRGEQYVRTTVGSLLEGLTPEERRSVNLNVLVAHTEPSKHPIYNETWTTSLPDKILAYKDSDLGQIRTWELEDAYRNKSVFDYTYLMKDCYDTGAQYIAMVEDDVLAARGWFPETLTALASVRTRMQNRWTSSDWIYLRLFYQESLFGWNSEYWMSYLFWSFVLWTTSLSTMLWMRNRSRKAQSVLTNWSLGVISCVYLPLTIILYFMAGRNSVLPLSHGVHEMNRFGCCSQGYVFPREIVPRFLEKTDLESDWLVDMMVEQIADKEGYVRWATTPSPFQHIGSTSSKGWGFDDSAKVIWNFGFELRD